MPEPTLLEPFPARVQAFGELVRSVAGLKVKAARAELAGAVSGGDWVRARVLEAVLVRLQNDAEVVDRSHIHTRRKVEELSEHARAASRLLHGAGIAAFGRAREAYRFFEAQALIEGDAAMFAAPRDPTAVPLAGPQFLDNRRPDRACDDPPAGDASNPLRLMDWAIRRQYVARADTPAHRCFVDLFRQIARVAGSTVATIEQVREALRTGRCHVWQPLRIPGAEPTPAEARILACTGPDAIL